MSTPNEAFLAKREKLLQGGGEARIQKQHEKGKLTARERLELLFDKDSFVEYGLFVHHRATEFGMDKVDAPADGVVTGFGTIGGVWYMPTRRMQRLSAVLWARCTASKLSV